MVPSVLRQLLFVSLVFAACSAHAQGPQEAFYAIGQAYSAKSSCDISVNPKPGEATWLSWRFDVESEYNYQRSQANGPPRDEEWWDYLDDVEIHLDSCDIALSDHEYNYNFGVDYLADAEEAYAQSNWWLAYTLANSAKAYFDNAKQKGLECNTSLQAAETMLDEWPIT